MKLIEIVPITVPPYWMVVLFILGALSLITAILLHDWDYAPIAALIGFTIIFVIGFLGHNKIGYVYDHDEYIIELTDMSATDFYAQYEPVKSFEYSNAIQVKKKDGVK